MKQKDHRVISEKELEKAAKEVLGGNSPKESLYENRKPTVKELNTKYKLIKRDK